MRGTYSRNLPGKGTTIHKILAVSAVDLFYKYIKNGIDVGSQIVLYDIIRELVRSSVEELCNEGVLNRDALRDEIVMRDSAQLLRRLAIDLPLVAKALGLDLSRMEAFSEQQLIDYNLHILGAPDLIIEDPEARRAIVIDWKTSGSPSGWEKAQIYTYALLEASRLGYGKQDLRELINAIASSNREEVKVYPLIIRPNRPYSDHPAYPLNVKEPLSPDGIEELLKKILVAACHLTLLITDVAAVSGYSKDDLLRECGITMSGYSGFLLRWTPPVLKKRGKPQTQERYPCTYCKAVFQNLAIACSFYFGRESLRTAFDKLMWKYRFIVYRIRERDMLPFKALFDISHQNRDYIIRKIEEGSGIEYEVSSRSFKSYEKSAILRVNTHYYNDYFEGRVDVFTDISFLDDSLVLRLARPLREYEILEEDIPWVRTIRSGKPIFVIFPELHTSAYTLSLNIFARATEMDITGNKVVLYAEPISNVLRLPFILLKRYFKYRRLNAEQCAVVVEVNADLTHIDLQAIDVLQRELAAKAEEYCKELSIEPRELRNIQQELISLKREIEAAIIGALG